MESSLTVPPTSPCALSVSTLRTVKRESVVPVALGEHVVSVSGGSVFQLDEYLSAHLSYKWLVALDYPVTPPHIIDINAAFVRRRAKIEYGIVSAVLLARLKNNLAHVANALILQAATLAIACGRTRITPSDVVGAQVVLTDLQRASFVGDEPPARRKAAALPPATAASSSSSSSSSKRAKTQMVVKALVMEEEQDADVDVDGEDDEDEVDDKNDGAMC